jgi:glycosyltransferase involved in cell wall biosynthesis
MQINANAFPSTDLVVWSHLRWDFVFQRPQHLLSRMAKHRRVFFVEEPMFTGQPRLEFYERENGVKIVVPQLPVGINEEEIYAQLRMLFSQMMETQDIKNYTSWYYTPMALPCTRHLNADVTIYDCMDELSLFKGAPARLLDLEAELLQLSDVVYTGGQSLWEAKKDRHSNCHAFPSSIDGAHFRAGRTPQEQPKDQASIPGPRLGFYGVVDERFDIELLRGAAALRPDWQFVIIGPVVKIDEAHLPKAANIHYLGMKSYKELPSYLSGWDLAFLPFARNESTRFISPTKTPEYLAAGRPVVSTSIRDVVRPYATERLVHIADTPEEFVKAAEKAMAEANADGEWLKRVDSFLSNMSWDQTVLRMARQETLAKQAKSEAAKLVRQVSAESRLGA